MKLSPQQRIILRALHRPRSIRELQNLNTWINAPWKRISELRALGWDIRDKWENTKDARYKVYWLESWGFYQWEMFG